MNCFIKELIEMRENTDITPTYISDIFFDYNFILKNKNIFNIDTKIGALNKIEEMLYQIKNDYMFLSKLNIDGKKLNFSSNRRGIVTIKGYQTEILKEFLKKINNSESKNTKIISNPLKTYNAVKDWVNLKLKFKQGLEDLEIFYKEKYIDTVNYKELGFSAATKNHKPNREWELLQSLSYFQKENPTRATTEQLKTTFSSKADKPISSDNMYHIKRNLSLKLEKIFFNIPKDSSPFDKTIKDYYKPLFMIVAGEEEIRRPEIYSLRIHDGKSREPFDFRDNHESLYEDNKNEEVYYPPEDPDGAY